MSGISTYESLAVVRTKGSGLDITTFKDELTCVLGLINNGSLGQSLAAPGTWGSSWGGDEHKQAIAKVEEHIVAVKAAIAEEDRAQAEHEARRPAHTQEKCPLDGFVEGGPTWKCSVCGLAAPF